MLELRQYNIYNLGYKNIDLDKSNGKNESSVSVICSSTLGTKRGRCPLRLSGKRLP